MELRAGPRAACAGVGAQRTPAAVARFLEIDGRVFPAFSTSDRDRVMRGFLHDPSDGGYGWHTTMWNIARRVTRNASTPYGAVLALESWFRQTGGFRYDESPPRDPGPPLEVFVKRTKAGYCQHFAGAMALMLRLLGVPARVAVGFTSGRERGRTMPGSSPTTTRTPGSRSGSRARGGSPSTRLPAEGRFGGDCSSRRAHRRAVAALRRGELAGQGACGNHETAPRYRRADAGDERGGRHPGSSGVGIVLAGALWMRVGGRPREGRSAAPAVPVAATHGGTREREPAGAVEGFLRDQGERSSSRTATLAELQRGVRQELGLDGWRGSP